MFGVPGNYLGLANETSGLAYTNTNDDRRKLYEDGLQQYIVRIEQAITDLLPRGQEAKFNLTAFLRPDDKTRYEGYKVALEAGFLTVNEVREFEGLPELTPAEQEELAPEPVNTDAIQLDQGDTNDTAN
jgi:phage portal protein BeeE